MDRREEELKQIELMVDFLCVNYPDVFQKGEYYHPVKGHRKTISSKEHKMQFDIENLERISFDYTENIIVVVSNSPDRVFYIQKFIKDSTVM